MLKKGATAPPCRGGIAASNGKFIIMGDADDSYDFLEAPKFIEKLRLGFDLVQGCRLPEGGGKIEKGAMPFLHRWIGNPMFSFLARLWFRVPIHDIYCGLRGFTKQFYLRLNQRCTGMEFATEMIIRSSLYGAKIAEVPITLHKDGRKAHKPHLKTFSDGWRTLRFFMLYSPRWLFLLPGVALIFLGFVGYCIAMPGISILGVTFDAHTLLFSSLFIICGYQSLLFSLFAKTFAVTEGMLPEDRYYNYFYKLVNLEKALVMASIVMIIGAVLLGLAVYQWSHVGFGELDYATTMRFVIPGITLVVLGFQTILSGFFVSLLGMERL